ncbi:hypothetical protein LEP1GSC024_0258 [Leptospira noguchii str. 2001034031]|uniref:Uncharacterized protein n=1 Tax=Leptospira noguchii str. 2001034031 TaxID=1193053 RepID=M6Y0N1_9LEPT|nr:hypothetical protein LEP1GSC024_0258 [Leptospira noguchii str. 2001034031]
MKVKKGCPDIGTTQKTPTNLTDGIYLNEGAFRFTKKNLKISI